MTLLRRYDVDDLDDALFAHVSDTLRFAYAGTVRGEGNGRKTITVELAGEEDARCVDAFVANVCATRRKLRHKVRAAHRAAHLWSDDVDAALAAAGVLHPLGEGLVGLSGLALRLFRFFEEEFRHLARRYHAEEHHYPVMVPIELLEEVSYFEHFPQHVTLCTHFPEELPFLERIAAAAHRADGALDREHRAQALPPGHALTPAVCLPCYPCHRGAVVDDDAVRAVTMQNHVFRYEGRNCRTLARCWDFTVRDLVVFGTSERLARLREEVMDAAMALCTELDLDAHLQLANDPFFVTEARGKRVYQRLGEVKYELLLTLPARDEQLAVSSFNLHRDFYTRIYGTRLRSGPVAESACMGFGLERWVYAFLAQKGLAPDLWPARAAAAVGDGAP